MAHSVGFVGGSFSGIGGRGGGGRGGRCSRGRRYGGQGEFEHYSRALIPVVSGPTTKPFDGYVGWDSPRGAAFISHGMDSPAFVDSARPVVLILSWMGASRKNIEKYTEFYRSRGCDVYFFLNNMGHAMLPIESRRQAHRVLETLSSIPEDRPVFVHAFSIGTGIYGYVVDMMRKQQKKFDNIAGVIYDSGPSMIFPSDVAKGLHTVCPNIHKAIWSVVAKSLFAVTQARKNFTVAEEALAKFQRPHVPQLYFYSADDKIIDRVGDSIGHFIDENRRRGVETFCKVFNNSKHAMHLRYHPEEYMDNLSQFLHRCLEKKDKELPEGLVAAQ